MQYVLFNSTLMLSQEQVDLIWTLLYDEALTDEEKEFTLHWVCLSLSISC